MPEPALLRIEGLTADYGAVRALSGVSMAFEKGRVHAVLGANGAGKTTLLRAIGGLHPVAAGRVLLRGDDVTRMPVEQRVRHGIAHVPEGGGIIVELTVAENIRLGALWRRRSERPAALAAAFDLFPPLAERRARPAATLSGGERQMLAIGRALAARPEVLLLDEPSLGLAPRVTRQIMLLLRRLCDSADMAVVLVEQNARGALAVSDRGSVLAQGEVVAAAAPGELLADDRMRHAYLGF
ncbi:branched-chain amino acid transport system ATP-binding protein [Murinocardiopsis flavida]|uniref:Branched-chain amino acid transport system ATP-binding protein n=1 Tax=Murinocardiopsis flavida TaxID=645275 RepID=A0A2P8DLR3_9ACTN|nr:ABC transporter ATP-binding protein [Murinocardiopsis flavida]PSK98138.1 branched-chain amino acid transport system ATP-binding protein [Murinocardiopsis flavida]